MRMSTAEPPQEPSDDELRAALEAQLAQVTAADVIVQSTVTLINLAGRRLGLAPDGAGERDLAQVRDAIDAVRGMLPVIERQAPAAMVGQLRDALSALQLEYTKLVGEAAGGAASEAAPAVAVKGAAEDAAAPKGDVPPTAGEGEQGEGAGPAQRSGRLWVPGS
jgi:hypothetical protein